MDDNRLYDLTLLAIGLGSVAWCTAFTLLLLRQDSRRKASSLNAVLASFSLLLAGLGEAARKAKPDGSIDTV